MEAFLETPLAALAGGILVGISATAVMFLLGRVAGISGVVGGLLAGAFEPWRVGFFLGLVSGGAILWAHLPDVFGVPEGRSLPMLALAGLLVGVGTRMGNGCTSGHGVCGVGRLAPRSWAATATFLGAGIFVATLLHTLGGSS